MTSRNDSSMRWVSGFAYTMIPAALVVLVKCIVIDTLSAPRISPELLAVDLTGIRPPAQAVPPRGPVVRPPVLQIPRPRPTLPISITLQVLRPAPLPPLLSPIGTPPQAPLP